MPGARRDRAARLAVLEALGTAPDEREAITPQLDELARALDELEAFAPRDTAPAVTFDPRWDDDGS